MAFCGNKTGYAAFLKDDVNFVEFLSLLSFMHLHMRKQVCKV
jgi:hypothetical protein